MSDHEVEAAKRLLERHNYRVLGPHEGQWAPSEEPSQYTSPDFSPVDNAVFNAVGLCGCGSPEEVQELLRACLASADIPWSQGVERLPVRLGEILVGSPAVAGELVAQFMDRSGLLEHGSSVNGAWLSKKGEWLLDRLSETREGA